MFEVELILKLYARTVYTTSICTSIWTRTDSFDWKVKLAPNPQTDGLELRGLCQICQCITNVLPVFLEDLPRPQALVFLFHPEN